MQAPKIATYVAALVLFSGCSFHKTPYKAYDGETPPAQTAVFAALDDKATKPALAVVTHVNGREMPCLTNGCPSWVRVLPGNNSFKIRYITNAVLSAGSITSNYADFEFDINNMQASHVYVARYTEHLGKVMVKVEDIGSRPKYGITLGLDRGFHPVTFD